VASEIEPSPLAVPMSSLLREEIRGEALVRNLPGFGPLPPNQPLSLTPVVNVAGIARDSGTALTTVQGYLEIPRGTLLAWRLAAFETRWLVR